MVPKKGQSILLLDYYFMNLVFRENSTLNAYYI